MLRGGRARLVRTAAWCACVAAALVTIAADVARAQTPVKAAARAVTLRIRPHVGDTLRMRMDQRFEMSTDGDRAARAKPMAASMRVDTRAVVLSATAAGAELLAITDSVTVTPPSAAGLPLFAQTRRALRGRKVRLRVSPTGDMTFGDKAPAQGTGAALGGVPALLPDKPVVPGDTWVRDLPVPLSATSDDRGLVHVTFAFDSLGPDGAVAYLSMHGTVSHDHDAKKTAARSTTTGTISGTMQVDRRAEWITDSRMSVALTTVVTRSSAEPMRVHMKVTQWMRAVPAP
jgi:hypothetical protein